MYDISNQQRDDIIKLLTVLQDMPDSNNKLINDKRRARVLIKKLARSKRVSYKQIKDITQ